MGREIPHYKKVRMDDFGGKITFIIEQTNLPNTPESRDMVGEHLRRSMLLTKSKDVEDTTAYKVAKKLRQNPSVKSWKDFTKLLPGIPTSSIRNILMGDLEFRYPFDMTKGTGAAKVSYSPEFKASVVKEFETTPASFEELSQKYGVHHTSIRTWVRKSSENGKGQTGTDDSMTGDVVLSDKPADPIKQDAIPEPLTPLQTVIEEIESLRTELTAIKQVFLSHEHGAMGTPVLTIDKFNVEGLNGKESTK